MIFKRNNEHFRAQETPGEKHPTDLQVENVISSSVVSGKPNSDCNIYIHLLTSLFQEVKNEHFRAQETPGEKLPTDLQLEKARLLCCFRQAKL